MIGYGPWFFSITRARAALVVVGDRAAAQEIGVEHLARFAKYVHAREYVEPPAPRCADDLGAEYPLVHNPQQVSEWENVLYRALYRAGIRTLPQYREDKYDLDLALFWDDRSLDIEIDGERYHRDWDGELCRRDQIRNQRLMELGWDVMRFWVYQVRDDRERCIARVRRWVDEEP